MGQIRELHDFRLHNKSVRNAKNISINTTYERIVIRLGDKTIELMKNKVSLGITKEASETGHYQNY